MSTADNEQNLVQLSRSLNTQAFNLEIAEEWAKREYLTAIGFTLVWLGVLLLVHYRMFNEQRLDFYVYLFIGAIFADRYEHSMKEKLYQCRKTLAEGKFDVADAMSALQKHPNQLDALDLLDRADRIHKKANALQKNIGMFLRFTPFFDVIIVASLFRGLFGVGKFTYSWSQTLKINAVS